MSSKQLNWDSVDLKASLDVFVLNLLETLEFFETI